METGEQQHHQRHEAGTLQQRRLQRGSEFQGSHCKTNGCNANSRRQQKVSRRPSLRKKTNDGVGPLLAVTSEVQMACVPSLGRSRGGPEPTGNLSRERTSTAQARQHLCFLSETKHRTKRRRLI